LKLHSGAAPAAASGARRAVASDAHVHEEVDVNDEPAVDEGEAEELPWLQRMLDNLWLLLAISIVVPGVMYLGWGLWELVELPTWGGR
jgi:hypothetical protein